MDYDRRLLMIKKVTGVFVPVLIAAAIIGIWFMKHNEKKAPSETADDFALEAAQVNLAQWKSYGLPMMIVFGSDSCTDCVEMAPLLKALHSAYQGKALIKYLNTGENPVAGKGFPLRELPAAFFYGKDGKPFVPRDPEAMQMTLYSEKKTGTHVYTAHYGGMAEEQIKDVLKEMGVK